MTGVLGILCYRSVSFHTAATTFLVEKVSTAAVFLRTSWVLHASAPGRDHFSLLFVVTGSAGCCAGGGRLNVMHDGRGRE